MSGIEIIKSGCTCGGDIRWFWYDGDCRGNDGGADITCQSCGRRFSVAEAQPLFDAQRKR